MLQQARARAGKGTQSSRIVGVGVGLAGPLQLCPRGAAAAARLTRGQIFLPRPSKPRTAVQALGRVLKTRSHATLLSSRPKTARGCLVCSRHQTHYHCLTLAELRKKGGPRHLSPPPDTVPEGTRPGHPHLDRFGVVGAETPAMHLLHGSTGLRATRELDEGDALGFLRVLVPHHPDILDLAER